MVGCPIRMAREGLGMRAVAPICLLILLFLWTSSKGFMASSSTFWYLAWHGLLLHNTSWVLLRTKPEHNFPNFTVRLAFLVVFTSLFKVTFPMVFPAFYNWNYFLSFLFFAGANLLCKAIPWYVELSTLVDTRALGEIFDERFRPVMYFGVTNHARFTPVLHKFKYPIMYFGFPVDFEGTINPLVSVRGINQGPEKPYWGKGSQLWTFFEADPTRYFNPHLPFSQKLDTVFVQEDIDKSLYNIFFVTTPTFLGYCFNPVSYWYLYDKITGELKFVVLEVNNTFGEKHVYVVRQDNPRNPATRKPFQWCGVIDKRFHISPFNHRSGTYHIHVADPLDNMNQGLLFNIQMVVIHRAGYKTMAAGVRSVQPGMDIVQATWRDILYTVVVWGFTQWMAIPRTMLEAFMTFKKGSVVYTRPEVLKGSGGRCPSEGEKEMAELWLEYFADRVQKYQHPLWVSIVMPQPHASRIPEIITYQNALASAASGVRGTRTTTRKDGKFFATELVTNNDNLAPPPFIHQAIVAQPAHLTIQVHNPRFFRRFFALQDPTQAVYLDILSQPYERHSAHINNMDLFLDVLLKSRSSDVGDGLVLQPQHSFRWRMLSYCRRLFSAQIMDARAKEMIAEGHYTSEQRLLAIDPVTGDRFDSLVPQSTTRFNTLDYYLSLKNFATISKYRRLSFEAYFVDVFAGGDVESFVYLIRIWGAVVYVARVLVMIYLGVSFGGRINSGKMLSEGENWSRITMAVLFGVVNFGWVIETVIGYL
ncbi:hypothetical protein BGX38DRAFT_1275271 [Terfezia claveryi]|nr:hypothetical protein BGX38DRAFT_1275271 [Terfezia claveryi]